MFKASRETLENENIGFQKIVSINAYQNVYYQFVNNALQKIDKLQYDKRNFVISTLDSKDFISSIIEISVNIPPEDLQDAIELKAYDDLGLDQAVEYIIRYIEIPGQKTEKMRSFHVFVAEPEVVQDVFDPIRQQVKYIDYIYPKPYLIQNIYERNILESYGVHGYLYFQKEDAFLALFRDGEYLYSKSLKYSFENIYERFCELHGERVDEEAFYDMLQNEGLKTSNFDYQDHLMKLFSEIFLYVNDILIYAKRAFEIEKIDMFYTGSETGPVLGLNEYAHTYLGIESSDFDFDYEMEKGEWYVDQFHYLGVLEAIKDIEGEESPNFTLFFRPPPFVARRSGQFIITTAATVVLALSLPVYNYTYDTYVKITNDKLKKEEKRLNTLVSSIKKEIGTLKKQKSEILSKIKDENDLFETKKKILAAIYDKKVNYPMKAKTIVSFGNDMSKFDVKVTKVFDEDNTFTLSLFSRSEKKITQFIKYLTDKYERKIHTDIDKIYKDEKSGIYHGDLKVTVL
ncbi:hypothetical protein [Hydrogenimonas cancrithermarum]|uniref:Fimbrial assembly protein n=1 Tax=Hydrogenimonas cancrithermarum TaxID=2993563 RepID=A0ABM8FK23_9BACT|nr:hypothetical protein [Hydrogenimonas cancrithermarum]BDY11993.1 hypothetical protein HCR_03050 [Hydrogenimonas cancrithermarum]